MPVAAASEPVVSRWYRLHLRLRPWYTRVLVATLLGLAAGAALGYFTGKPVYRAQGLIEFTPSTGFAVRADELVSASFDAFVQHQAALASSPDLIADALHRPGWDTAAPPSVDWFTGRLEVVRTGQSPNQLHLSFTDRNPVLAAAAVNSLIDELADSCNQSLRDEASEASKARLARDQLVRELDSLQRQIDEAQSRSVEIPQAPTPQEIIRLKEVLADVDLALVSVQVSQGAGADSPANSLDQQATRLARTDPVMAALLSRKLALEHRLAELSRVMGENARDRVAAAADLTQVKDQIRLRVEAASAVSARVPSLSSTTSYTPEELRKLRDDYTHKLDAAIAQANAQTAAQSQQAGGVRELRARADRLRRQIDDAEAQLRRLEDQHRSVGRALVEQRAVVTPIADPRSQFAALGAIAGGLCGLLTLLTVALLDDRMRRPQSAIAASPSTPVIGTVPAVAPGSNDPRDADLTALSIHEIRAIMQVRRRTDGARTFAITSPSKGAGKTSLTVGLASSLAMSGTRTLLVDCELTSRVLESALNSRKDADAPAGSASRLSNQSVDEVMVSMGYLNQRDAELFVIPEGSRLGLSGMLDGGSLTQCAIKTSIPGLAILPALGARSEHVGRLSCQFIHRLIKEARKEYDMIVFDTGPVPGSVEALCVASEADAVILVASRGESMSRFNRTLAHLRVVGATIAGTVFNRADRSDLSLRPSDLSPAAEANKPAGLLPGSRRRHQHLIEQRSMGSGILAAAVQNQGSPRLTRDGQPPSPTPESERPLEPSDAGEIIQELLNKPASVVPPTSVTAEAPVTPAATPAADHDLDQALDDLVSEVLANSSNDRTESLDPQLQSNPVPPVRTPRTGRAKLKQPDSIAG